MEISTISGAFFCSYRAATSCRNLPMFAPIIVYGISVITRFSFPPLVFSTSTLPRSLIFPTPVSYMDSRSSLLQTMPPVGKSGPFTYFISSRVVMFSFSIYALVASMISPRLCGGILVTMPTAMPSEPFTSRLGNRQGRTLGSFSVSSKFGTKSTTSLSRSDKMASWVIFCRRASVYRMAAAPSPSILPKLPWPSISGIPFLKSCVRTTSAS